MWERCSVCDLKFQREEGYFLGAMYISFGLALVIIALIALRALDYHWLVDHPGHDLGRRAIPATGAGNLNVGSCTLDLS